MRVFQVPLDRLEIGIVPFCPLENGLLTGKVKRDMPPPEGTRLSKQPAMMAGANFAQVEALERFADERGISMLEVAIGGLLAKPQVMSVIAGARLPDQVKANAAAGRWRPTEADVEELDRISEIGDQ